MRSLEVVLFVLLITIRCCENVVRRSKVKPTKSDFSLENIGEFFSSDDCDNVSSESENCEEMFIGYKSQFRRPILAQKGKLSGSYVNQESYNQTLCCMLIEIDDFRSKCCETLREVCENINGQCFNKTKSIKSDKKKKRRKSENDKDKSAGRRKL